MKHLPTHFRRLAILIVLTLLVTPALARGFQGHGPRHGGCDCPDQPMHGRLFAQLDLTDDQRQEIDRLMTEHRTAMEDSRDQMRALRQELMDRTHAETLDEAAVRTAARAVADAEVERAVERARMMQQIRQVLTPEQRAEADEMFRQRRDRMEEDGPGFRHRGKPFNGRGRHPHWND